MEALLIQAIGLFFYLLEMLIFVRIILSWIIRGYNNPIVRFLDTFTEPILGPVREMLSRSPLGGGYGLDFSPIFALILMRLVQTLLISGVQMIF
jgi:YggT family protein